MNLLDKTLDLSYWKRLKIAFQYVMPQKYLTQFAGWFAERKWGAVTHFAIKMFAKKYDVDMSEAAKEDFSDYASFNEFFIRKLKDDARKIDENPTALCQPADGKISQRGHIFDETLLQAKGHSFSLRDLLADDEELTETFKNGEFVTTYLSPRDYHRVHMPCDATLRKMIYVPGDLFSVNPFLNEHIPNLLARNERVICVFDTEFGKMVQILVGATITASISTIWAGTVNPPRLTHVKSWNYDGEQAVTLTKGQEMGAFRLGSTVINLFQQDRVKLAENLEVDSVTRVGEVLAFKN
ncbi:phosphatidylserine decarboxylase [Actinobacillus succinogenes]|uniref:Phosphatidylserine decarboxylase proenzyme n=1 Tax=Actinobacillus succinogenes (strain ATCC 55618 / DSM 22257 / CCUG 43843 / 130Z) TaxID=339671 RepID=A6VM95_ACTSZ|nr:archaetidylserine decarboxylase [Actinobacillus succinogenes]ABR74092.1 phosphatidylserine decarboxylase [Actinobacillus succinogenes 130Z]PHI39474.1 phosphatidylserine decarboxylase [Actinobacillus succinogenes]